MPPVESSLQTPFARAVSLLNPASRLDWAGVVAAQTRALELAGMGQPREAAEMLREALRSAIDPEPLNNLAVLQHNTGNSSEAENLLRMLVNLYPEYPTPARNLAALTPDTAKAVPVATFGDLGPTSDSGEGGMVYYGKNYDNEGDCPADRDIASYLELHESSDGGLTVFHFGTGSHHHLGLTNHHRQHPNRIIGVTASPGEYGRYVELCLSDGSLGSDYLVYFGDIYNLQTEFLPTLDVASMPHIGEYYDSSKVKEPGVHVGGSTNRSYAALNDRSLVELIVDKLAEGGRLLTYPRSHGAEVTRAILDELVSKGRLSYLTTYQSVDVFIKTS